MKNAVTREEALNKVRETLQKLGVSEEVRFKVVAVFVNAKSAWWLSPPDYVDYLVRQLVTLFSYKFEDERMSIPANMVYLVSTDGAPSILLHWKIYLSLYKPWVKGWRLETIKDSNGEPVGMIAIIVDKEGNEWRWERYYNNLALVSRWKNKEIMFAKTILKEALGVIYPELNLLPPLSVVESYDPDDLDSQPVQAPTPTPTTPNVGNGSALSSGGSSSTEAVKNMTTIPPSGSRRDKSQDGDLAREIMDKFKELSSLVGSEDAKGMIDSIIRDLGASRFNDLSNEKKRFVIATVDSAIETEKALKRK